MSRVDEACRRHLVLLLLVLLPPPCALSGSGAGADLVWSLDVTRRSRSLNLCCNGASCDLGEYLNGLDDQYKLMIYVDDESDDDALQQECSFKIPVAGRKGFDNS